MSLDLPRLVERARGAEADAATARRAIGLLDLTLLGEDDREADIVALCARAAAARTAAVCVWPRFAGLARAHLEGSGVRVAAVTNFPDGGDDLARAADETAAAVAAGADEVDVVAPIQAVLEGDIGLVGELVELCRAAAAQDTVLKVILETGRLERPELITAACRAAVMAGASFLKTSTGKVVPGASLEAAALLLASAREAEGRVGVKVAGGIRSAEDAAAYLALADAAVGPERVTPATFRIGASSLLQDLERRLGRDAGGVPRDDGY